MNARRLTCTTALVLAALVAPGASGQTEWAAPPWNSDPLLAPPGTQQRLTRALSRAELEDLVGPIALYPDALLAQVLAASTFPLDVVQANRWRKSNPHLEGIEDCPWDPSVLALTHYPTVIEMMDADLDWTMRLGDAFLSQREDVMDAVQRLRAQARTVGSLCDTPQQVVYVEQDVIRIVPAVADVIYVPTYVPQYVYGHHHHHLHHHAPSSFVSFSIGFSWGHWLDLDCDWHRHHVYHCWTPRRDNHHYHDHDWDHHDHDWRHRRGDWNRNDWERQFEHRDSEGHEWSHRSRRSRDGHDGDWRGSRGGDRNGRGGRLVDDTPRNSRDNHHNGLVSPDRNTIPAAPADDVIVANPRAQSPERDFKSPWNRDRKPQSPRETLTERLRSRDNVTPAQEVVRPQPAPQQPTVTRPPQIDRTKSIHPARQPKRLTPTTKPSVTPREMPRQSIEIPTQAPAPKAAPRQTSRPASMHPALSKPSRSSPSVDRPAPSRAPDRIQSTPRPAQQAAPQSAPRAEPKSQPQASPKPASSHPQQQRQSQSSRGSGRKGLADRDNKK